MMTGKSIVMAVFFSLQILAVQAHAQDVVEKRENDSYLKLGAGVQNEPGSEAEQYMVALGVKYDKHIVLKEFMLSGKAEVYYKKTKVNLENEYSKTSISGFGVGSLEYDGYVKNDHGVIPYLKLSFENIDTEKNLALS
jgi:hypothetical protein